jgi:hypothetical protein
MATIPEDRGTLDLYTCFRELLAALIALEWLVLGVERAVVCDGGKAGRQRSWMDPQSKIVCVLRG